MINIKEFIGGFIIKNEEMKLKVAEAFSQADVGRSIARIDPACMGKLDLLDGDMIEIEGRKLTATTVASSQSDIGLGIIRIDGYIRKNAGTSLGEEVTVRKAEVKEAQKVYSLTVISEPSKMKFLEEYMKQFGFEYIIEED